MSSDLTIAVLALQGAFLEHQQVLDRLHVNSILIRKLSDWDSYTNAPGNKALIIPGGESTAMMRIIKDELLYGPVRQAILNGMPVFGTCAGLIMLDPDHINTMNIKVKRNAYGRQLGSFYTEDSFQGLTNNVPMTFIRAPYIEEVGKNVRVLSLVNGHIVAARQDKQLVTAFHPELNDDLRIHQYFLNIIGE